MCRGFKAAGVPAGLKKKGGKDLGLILSEKPATVAGVFTNNRVKAAPVLLDMQRAEKGVCRAFIANSGNANCCTGEKGMEGAIAMGKAVSAALAIEDDTVMVASTGVIGQPFPVEKIQNAVPQLVASLSDQGFSDFAQAIMTTDTVPKIVARNSDINGIPFEIKGIAKGAGMIRPDMATMLCFVCTDIAIGRPDLKAALVTAANNSFNRITIDGDTSTNDTILVMANGMSGAEVQDSAGLARFQEILDEVLITLAKMVVKDGEGATKLVEIAVSGAASVTDARRMADTVAHSPLVKTAIFGEDANWGRILAALGRAGVPFDPEKTDIWFDDIRMVENGTGCGDAAEAAATRVLKKPEFRIGVDLKSGNHSDFVWTCDFSIDYVKINADYRS